MNNISQTAMGKIIENEVKIQNKINPTQNIWTI